MPVTLRGQVSDVDGQPVVFSWSEGDKVLCSGQLDPQAGDTPLMLPECVLPSLPVGPHTLVLTARDSEGGSVSRSVSVDVIDTTAPLLEADADRSTIWPPNRELRNIQIQTRASDNSGGPVVLSATVSSNEVSKCKKIKDVDWTEPVIDQTTGRISVQMRAERSDPRVGRNYTVTVIATDSSGNRATTDIIIDVSAPESTGCGKRGHR